MRLQATLLLIGSGLSLTMPAAPAAAQVQDQVVTVYGNDPCPASNGQEIVVCRRLPNAERFRIPKDLRDSDPTPQAVGNSAALAVRSTGGNAAQIQSCNAIGAGVDAGCLKKEIDRSAAERRAERKNGTPIN